MAKNRSRLILIAYIASLIFLFMPNTYATQIGMQDVTIELFSDLSAKMNVNLTFKEITTTEIYYIINARVSNLKSSDDSGAVPCSIEQISYGTQIVCKPGKNIIDGYNISFAFDADGLQRPEGNAYLFTYNTGIRSPTDEFRLNIILPEGLGLVEANNGAVPYYPESGKIGSTGRKISIEWVEVSPQLGKTYSYDATYEKVTSSVSDFYIYIILGIIAVFAVALKYARKPKVETILSVMKEDEKKVLDVIIANGGTCIQRKIVKDTDFSKARVSRIISDLEVRGIVKKIPKGRTNVIEFVDVKNIEKKKEAEDKPVASEDKKKEAKWLPLSRKFFGK